MTNIHLVETKGSLPKSKELSAMDNILLAIGGKVMTKSSQTGQAEPKISLICWLALVSVIALVVMSFFFGRLDGFSKGIEEGKEQSTLEQLQKQIETLQKQKTDEEKFKQNLKIAEEFDKKQKEEKTNANHK
jgi:hypothetical protein